MELLEVFRRCIADYDYCDVLDIFAGVGLKEFVRHSFIIAILLLLVRHLFLVAMHLFLVTSCF